MLSVSKSKIGCYNGCHYAYKLAYIDKLEQAPNEFFIKGIDVHSFHDKFFSMCKVTENNELIYDVSYGDTNHNYKKNIVEYYLKKWEKCIVEKGRAAPKYFFPYKKEEKIRIKGLIDDVEVVGIPDSIDRDFDDELCVVEVKTGKPNASKCTAYRNDIVWYKMLGDYHYKENIKRGRIYFPYSNYTCNHVVDETDVTALKNEIIRVANLINAEEYTPTQDANSCYWCGYKNVCEHVVKK